MDIIKEIEKQYLKKEIPEFNIGDTVDVHVKIREGDKERVQVFTGTVIARKGNGIRETFTVRRMVGSEGVERSFPLHAPAIDKILVKRGGKVRRAKLYYLRGLVGKSTKVKERLAADTKAAKKAARKAKKIEVPGE